MPHNPDVPPGQQHETPDPAGDSAGKSPDTTTSPLLIWGGIGLAAAVGFLAARAMAPSSAKPHKESRPAARSPSRPRSGSSGQTSTLAGAINDVNRLATNIGLLLTAANAAADLARQILIHPFLRHKGQTMQDRPDPAYYRQKAVTDMTGSGAFSHATHTKHSSPGFIAGNLPDQIPAGLCDLP
ncbi:MAG: hypothetical protein ACK5II_02890 [Paracoccus sp. (in: a-proteobacteria)]